MDSYNNIDILFVLVLYKCKLNESITFITLQNSLRYYKYNSDFLVYDNSPGFNENEEFEQFINCNVTYHADSENNGVSKAYNTGAILAVKLKKKWIVLLDQDTNFPIETIDQYLSVIKKYPDEKIFAPIMLLNEKKIISPCHFKFMRGFYASKAEIGINSFKHLSLINCGICVDVIAFEKNNGYNEKLKLDFSDHDFIKRFKKTVTERFVVIDLKVYHNLSTETRNSFDGDRIRFNYFLNIGNHMNVNFIESIFVKFNLTMRALKLSVIHKTFYFFSKLLNSKGNDQGR